MTATATLIQTGPIDGGFEASGALFALSKPVTYVGVEYDQLIVSVIDEDIAGPASAIALPRNENGFAYDFNEGLYFKHEGSLLTHEQVLNELGYELVPSSNEA